MASKPRGDQARQNRAWELRQHGWTQARIAKEIGVDQGQVSRWLDATERRELARLSQMVEAAKVRQNAILETIVDESLQAWQRSIGRRTRAVSKVGADGKEGQRVIEATVSEGEPAYLDRALRALEDQRHIWGIDAPPKVKDDQAGGFTLVAAVQRMRANAAEYERHKAQDEADAQADG